MLCGIGVATMCAEMATLAVVEALVDAFVIDILPCSYPLKFSTTVEMVHVVVMTELEAGCLGVTLPVTVAVAT